ncbi:MAG: TCP-1/cpn60 chaperonin family protein [Bacillota bacterium]
MDENLSAFLTNAGAACAIASAVGGILGSKGLDRFGETVIADDGITVLETMQPRHPAARLAVNTARAGEAAVGDGTTTATVLAAALLAEGVNRAMKGVPVTRIVAGLTSATERAVGFDCVIEALSGSCCQIVDNAGFNSLEKMEEVVAAQTEGESSRLGIDCDRGQIADMVEPGWSIPFRSRRTP